MKLEGKNILIISPEPWGVNMLSKHHYAIELAKRNNKVYFLPPAVLGEKKATLTKLDAYPGISIIQYSSRVAGLSRLPSFITDMLARFDRAVIGRAANCQFDIVWNFDMYRFQNPKLFSPELSILHPVDYVTTPLELRAARLYDFVFSVTTDIVEKLKPLNQRTFFINHGLSEHFISRAISENQQRSSRVWCGYVGNLLSFGIHYENLLTIVSHHQEVEFHFIGPYINSNLGASRKSRAFIDKLQTFENVHLHGEMHPEKVAAVIWSYDMFLIAYDPESVGKVAGNNHKILEYLSTGKVIVSSRISSYDTIAEGLFEMVDSSRELPARFSNTLRQLKTLNSETLQKKRREFARNNTYLKQIERIEAILAAHSQR